MKNLLMVGAIVLLLSGAAWADPLVTFNSSTVSAGQMIGRQLNYVGNDGGLGDASMNSDYADYQFGFQLGNLDSVSSFTIQQDPSGGRAALKNITVYYGSGANQGSATFTLADTQAAQTIHFSSPVQTNYLLIGAQYGSYYTDTGSNLDIGIQQVAVNGTVLGATSNLNLLPGVTVSGSPTSTSVEGNTPAGLGAAIDGIVAMSSGQGNVGNGVFWNRGTSATLTVTYPGEQTVGSIALNLASNDGSRHDQAQWVTVSWQGGGSQTFQLADAVPYQQFDLTAPVTTNSLTLTFDSAAADLYQGWDFWDSGNYAAFGISEFQAFAPVEVTTPEPATMAFLLFGGLSLAGIGLRRRTKA